MAEQLWVPGTPRLRTSERRSFKRCPQQWDWVWRKGLVPKYPKPGALWFGTGVHLALQHRYSLPGKQRGFQVLKTWRDYVGDTQANVWLDELDGLKAENALELGEIMLGGYLDEYGLDDRWSVISAEQTFEYPVYHPSSNHLLLNYNGTFDLVARDEADDGVIWLWDHKTARTISTDHLSLDDQAGSYWAVASEVLKAQGLIRQEELISGILYNFLRKGKPDLRPKNAAGQATNKPTKAHYLDALRAQNVAVHDRMTIARLQEEATKWSIPVIGEVSQRQPAALFYRAEVWRTQRERATQIRRIRDEHLHMDAVRRRILPIIKNPTQDCARSCVMFDMCELHEAGDDWRAYRDAMFNTADPYEFHRESADTEEF